MRPLTLLFLCLCLVSCAAGVPRIVAPPATGQTAAGRKPDLAPLFPSGTWRFVHSIEATLPGGRKTVLMGVTEVSSTQRTLHCVLMSIEGLVLFDGRKGRTIRVDRAVPPFNSGKFAQGLMADVSLMLLSPPGTPVETGTLENGQPVYRYRTRTPDGKPLITDVIRQGKHRWTINQYEAGRLRRHLRALVGRGATAGTTATVPEKWELTVPGPRGYDLRLTLLEAAPAGPS